MEGDDSQGNDSKSVERLWKYQVININT